MTTATAPPTTTSTAPGWVNAVIAFQTAYGIGALVIAALILTDSGFALSGLTRTISVALVVVAGLLNLASVMWVRNRNHRGRVTAFFLDYALVVWTGFLLLQEINLFNGLDALGETFGSGLVFLGIVAIGWIVNGYAERFPGQAAALKLAARWMMGIGGAVLLIRIGIIPGLLEFLRRIVQPGALIYLAPLVLAVVIARLLWRSEATEVFGSTRQQVETMDGFMFVSPNVIGFLAFFLGPLVFSLFVSFTQWDGLTDAEFIGLTNYIDLFSDDVFWTSMRNVVIFGLVAVPASIAPALLLAALLNSKLPGVKVFRAVYFIPSIAGVVGVALIWKQLYNATIGFINYAILQFYDFLNLLPGLELTAPQPQWLSEPSTALMSVMIVFAWQTIGFNTVLFLAGMQSVPGSLYEAAEIDGANAWNKFRKITIPMLKPTTVFVVATTTILALQLFNEPFILNAPQLPPNGVNNSTLTPVIYLYQNAFERFNQGYASAIAWVLFILIFGITLFYFRRQGDEGVLSA